MATFLFVRHGEPDKVVVSCHAVMLLFAGVAMVAVLLFSGCSAEQGGEEKDVGGIEAAELVEVKMSMENFYDYFDFKQLPDGRWIAVNEKYGEGMVIWDDSSLNLATGTRFDEEGDHVMICGIFLFVYSKKPQINDIRGSVLFAVNGKKYLDEEGWLVIECGTKQSRSELSDLNERVKYLDQYPY